jgi:phosphomannomutase
MTVNRNIFKEYDIRGVYPKEINQDTVHKIGRGFVEFLKLKAGDEIVVGQDQRSSSSKLAQAFISALFDSRINVIDIGKVTTPMLYFAVPFFRAKGGVMITASHITKNSNGIKFTRKDAEPIGGKEIQKIYEITKRLG